MCPVHAMARSLGMANTNLAQAYIGCGFRGGVRNTLGMPRSSTAVLIAARASWTRRQPDGNAIGQAVV